MGLNIVANYRDKRFGTRRLMLRGSRRLLVRDGPKLRLFLSRRRTQKLPVVDGRFPRRRRRSRRARRAPLTLDGAAFFPSARSVAFSLKPSRLFLAFRKRPPVRNAKIRYNVDSARRRFSARPPIPVGERRRKTPRRPITRFTEFTQSAQFVKIHNSRNLRKV